MLYPSPFLQSIPHCCCCPSLMWHSPHSAWALTPAPSCLSVGTSFSLCSRPPKTSLAHPTFSLALLQFIHPKQAIRILFLKQPDYVSILPIIPFRIVLKMKKPLSLNASRLFMIGPLNLSSSVFCRSSLVSAVSAS